MRHYEIIFLVHPDQSEQVTGMVERCTKTITESGGQVYRLEDWGRRQLAYPIRKIHKAHYILMNVECDDTVLSELTTGFRYNDAILRHLVILEKQAITEESPIMTAEKNSREQKVRSDDDAASAAASSVAEGTEAEREGVEAKEGEETAGRGQEQEEKIEQQTAEEPIESTENSAAKQEEK